MKVPSHRKWFVDYDERRKQFIASRYDYVRNEVNPPTVYVFYEDCVRVCNYYNRLNKRKFFKIKKVPKPSIWKKLLTIVCLSLNLHP